MRVSKLFWLYGPEPEPTKLLSTPLPGVGAGNKASIFPTAGEILPMGIMFPANCVRPEPSLGLPVAGSYIFPVPFSPAAPKYWLRSQDPGVALVAFVAGLQVLITSAVGIVSPLLRPPSWRVPW